jgi:hypothetical protein
MRFSLDATFLVLALAHVLVVPTNASGGASLQRYLLKSAADDFHKSALRHTAGLANDIRVAFRGLGASGGPRASLTRRSNNGNKPYCISSPVGSSQQTNTTADFHHSSSPGSATSTKKGAPSSTGAAGSNPTGQSNFHIVQSYVRASTRIIASGFAGRL